VDDLKLAMDEGSRMVIIDARPVSDWVAGHIRGALPFPFFDVGNFAVRLPRDGTWIIAYCGCPHALSTEAVEALRALGFASTAVLDEGVFVWQERGYPMD
jgi:rhodanese-related sulfurtransferase